MALPRRGPTFIFCFVLFFSGHEDKYLFAFWALRACPRPPKTPEAASETWCKHLLFPPALRQSVPRVARTAHAFIPEGLQILFSHGLRVEKTISRMISDNFEIVLSRATFAEKKDNPYARENSKIYLAGSARGEKAHRMIPARHFEKFSRASRAEKKHDPFSLESL